MNVGNKWKSQSVDELLDAILMLKNKKEAKKFLRDLLTEPELLEFAQRWKVAQLLSQNVPYATIEKQTGMSSRTIARISDWLSNGMGGYKLMLKKLQNNKKFQNSHPRHQSPRSLASGLMMSTS